MGGSGNTLLWYTSSCNSLIIGTGNPFVVASPSSSTIYYSNCYNSGCIPSLCKSIEVIVNQEPVSPVFANTDTNNYCVNYSGNITLTVSGGSGYTLEWFANSCGGISIGTGNTLIKQANSVNTTYYARWEVQIVQVLLVYQLELPYYHYH